MEVADTGTLLDISLNEAVNNEILLVLLLLLPLLSELDFSLIVVDTGTLLMFRLILLMIASFYY